MVHGVSNTAPMEGGKELDLKRWQTLPSCRSYWLSVTRDSDLGVLGAFVREISIL
ncbi:MAG: hypothetical protein RL326_1698 [Pseudomonadota bacterium]